MIVLQPQPLTAELFAPFGEVVEIERAQKFSINQGLTTRFHDLLTIDTEDRYGRPVVSVFRSKPLPLPHRVTLMERHPLGSQARHDESDHDRRGNPRVPQVARRFCPWIPIRF